MNTPWKKLYFLFTLAAAPACSGSGDLKPAHDVSSRANPGAPDSTSTPSISPSQAQAKEAQAPRFEGPGALLPQAVGSWQPSSPPRYFGPDNLYDLINGGAEVFVEFGLAKMVTADYADPSRKTVSVTVEIYDQGSERGAFGRFGRFLSGHQEPGRAGMGLPADLASRSIFGNGDLVFWKNKYLVHASVLDESPAATPESQRILGLEILPRLGAEISKRILAGSEAFMELAAFPAKGRIARSETWEPKKLAGLDDVGPGFSVRYAQAKARWVLFASDPRSDSSKLDAARLAAQGASVGERRVTVITVGQRLVGAVQDQGPYLNPKALDENVSSLAQKLSK